MSVITNGYPVHVQLGSNDDGCRPSPAQILVKVAILLLDRRDRSLTLKPRQIPPVWLSKIRLCQMEPDPSLRSSHLTRFAFLSRRFASPRQPV